MQGVFLWCIMFVCYDLGGSVCLDLPKLVLDFQSLRGHGYRNFIVDKTDPPVDGVLICISECLKATNCHSINYENSTRRCTLNTASNDTGSYVPLPSETSMFVDMSTWPFPLVKPCAGVTCPRNEKCIAETATRLPSPEKVAKCVPDEVSCSDPPTVDDSVASIQGRFTGASASFTCKRRDMLRVVYECSGDTWVFRNINCQNSFLENTQRSVAYESCQCLAEQTCLLFVKNETSDCINNNMCRNFPASTTEEFNHTFAVEKDTGIHLRSFYACPEDHILCARAECQPGEWTPLSKECRRNVWTDIDDESFPTPCPFQEGWQVNISATPTKDTFSINLRNGEDIFLRMNAKMYKRELSYDSYLRGSWQHLRPSTVAFPFNAGVTFQLTITNMGGHYEILVDGTKIDKHYDSVPEHVATAVSTDRPINLNRIEILPQFP